MYRAVRHFIDMTDNNFQYKAGDVFPREGLEVEQNRIDQLLSDKNKLKQAVIEIVVEPENVNEKPKIEEAAKEVENVSEEAEEKPKAAQKKRGKHNAD